jgi:segregation and condensation protein B
MSLASQLESILFVASKPLAVSKMAKVVQADEATVHTALQELKVRYSGPEAGIVLLENGSDWQMVSNPDNTAVTEKFVKAEISGELTKAQLETLTVISYCGPITKPELEQLRGVNCSLILRNLMMRGLVKENEGDGLLPTFEVTMDYVRHLGLSSITELPDYAELHQHGYITNALVTPEISP